MHSMDPNIMCVNLLQNNEKKYQTQSDVMNLMITWSRNP
jgi:hypothetical protein